MARAPPAEALPANLSPPTGIRDVRVRSEQTEAMFEPLRQTVQVLKKYGVNVQDTALAQLQGGAVRV